MSEDGGISEDKDRVEGMGWITIAATFVLLASAAGAWYAWPEAKPSLGDV
jgi:hypothetical protein